MRVVPKQLQSISGEAFKFLLAGAANTAISYGIYLLLNLWLPYQASWTLAYILGIVVSYVLQAKWVFHMPLSWKNFMAFPLVYLAQWLLGIALLASFVEWLGLHESLAPLVVPLVTLPVTFVMARLIVRHGVKV
jgi:putative flippase GtrA